MSSKPKDSKSELVPHRELNRNYLQKGSQEQMLMLSDLSKEIARYDSNAVDYISQSINWMKTKDDGKSQVNSMNKMYSQYLMMECVKPILHGHDPDAVFQSMGIMIAAYATNEEFRKTLNDAAQKAVYPFVKSKSEKEGPNSRWRNWCDKIETNMNDGHLPLCGKSAAALRISVDKKFYNDMRQDGADVTALQEQYRTMCEQIYDIAENDGISRDMVDNNVRTLVGQMQDVDPAVSRMYQQTAFESVKRSSYHEAEVKDVEGNVTTQYVWDGQFEHKKTGEPFTGAFDVRTPTTQFQWVDRLNGSMQDGFGRCHTADDVMLMGRVMNGEKISDIYGADSPEVDKYSWMTEWNRKNERDFSVMYDDCRNVDDYEKLDRCIEDVTGAHFENWMRAHPKEAEKVAGYYADKSADKNAAYNDEFDFSKGTPYIPPERRVEMPDEFKDNDNPELPEPTYGD